MTHWFDEDISFQQRVGKLVLSDRMVSSDTAHRQRQVTLTVKASEWGLDTVARLHFEVLHWKQHHPGLYAFILRAWTPKSAQQKVALTKEPIFRSDCISTIYPKSRFCTKRHKRRCFQGFSGFFESFSRKAEKENCKFEHRKCSFVFRSRLRKQACCLGRGFFFAYSEGDIGGWNRLYA